MSFCGRRTYIDSNGKCHNIQGKTVHEIKALVNGNVIQNTDNNQNTDNTFGSSSSDITDYPDMVLDETWDNGTRKLSGVYVYDGMHNEKPSYKRADQSTFYIYWAKGNEGRSDNVTDFWVLKNKIKDGLRALATASFAARPTGDGLNSDLKDVQFEFYNGSKWVVPSKVKPQPCQNKQMTFLPNGACI